MKDETEEVNNTGVKKSRGRKKKIVQNVNVPSIKQQQNKSREMVAPNLEHTREEGHEESKDEER